MHVCDIIVTGLIRGQPYCTFFLTVIFLVNLALISFLLGLIGVLV